MPTARPLAPPVLSPREAEILSLVARGRSNREIAAHLAISAGTVKNRLRRIFLKLDARDRFQAVLAALRRGAIRL
jgi:DNA-binding NarL/FixJ family response regulator